MLAFKAKPRSVARLSEISDFEKLVNEHKCRLDPNDLSECKSLVFLKNNATAFVVIFHNAEAIVYKDGFQAFYVSTFEAKKAHGNKRRHYEKFFINSVSEFFKKEGIQWPNSE